MTLRLGLIGAGYWGEKLLRVFGALSEVAVIAVADSDPARAAAMHGTSDAVRVIHAPDIDAVIIATPPSQHYAIARDVLAAGKHCWVEKPLAMSVAEARDLVARAAAAGRTLFVDETFLYDPLLRQAQTWIRTGRLGELFHLSFQRLGLGRIRRDSDIWWNSAPHDLAILRYLVPAEAESVRVERFAYLQPGIADLCVGTLRLAGGISVHLYLSWLSPEKVASVVAVGSRGMLRYEGRFGQRALTLYDCAISDPQEARGNVVAIDHFEAVETISGGSEEPLALAAAAFIESVRTGQPAPSDGAHSLRVVELLAAGDAAPQAQN